MLAEPLRAAGPGDGFTPRGDRRMRRAGTGAGPSSPHAHPGTAPVPAWCAAAAHGPGERRSSSRRC